MQLFAGGINALDPGRTVFFAMNLPCNHQSHEFHESHPDLVAFIHTILFDGMTVLHDLGKVEFITMSIGKPPT